MYTDHISGLYLSKMNGVVCMALDMWGYNTVSSWQDICAVTHTVWSDKHAHVYVVINTVKVSEIILYTSIKYDFTHFCKNTVNYYTIHTHKFVSVYSILHHDINLHHFYMFLHIFYKTLQVNLIIYFILVCIVMVQVS